jgi:hypothetical protein
MQRWKRSVGMNTVRGSLFFSGEDIGTVLCEAGPRSCAHAPQAGRLQFHLESGEWAPCTSEAKRLRGQSSLNANQRCSTKSSSLQMLVINLG